MDITVEPLSNHPELIPVVAEWHFKEWGHTDYYDGIDVTVMQTSLRSARANSPL